MNNQSPIPPDKIEESFRWRDWFREIRDRFNKVTSDGTTATTVGAAGTAATLPAKPVGYLNVTIGIPPVTYKIPFYNV